MRIYAAWAIYHQRMGDRQVRAGGQMSLPWNFKKMTCYSPERHPEFFYPQLLLFGLYHMRPISQFGFFSFGDQRTKKTFNYMYSVGHRAARAKFPDDIHAHPGFIPSSVSWLRHNRKTNDHLDDIIKSTMAHERLSEHIAASSSVWYTCMLHQQSICLHYRVTCAFVKKR